MMSISKVLPRDFLRLLEKNMRADDITELIEILDQEPAVSIRSNPLKSFSKLSEKPVPWCSSGYYLTERPSFTLDPLFHAGAYYVQEASSMFVEQIIKNHFKGTDEIKSLDLCAAPGGKSTHLLSLLSKHSLLVSNEVIRSRANILSENIQKWGNANVIVTQNDPSDFSQLEGYFNLIVVDAPCSGEGLFRKDHESVHEWSLKNVEHCSQRQKRILSDIFPALCYDGLMIYCTCTFNPIENEENLIWLSQQKEIEFVKVPEAEQWGIEETIRNGVVGYRFLPHRVQGEGFFVSGIIRREKTKTVTNFRKQIPAKQQLAKLDFEHDFINEKDQLNFACQGEDILFYPKRWANDIANLNSTLRCLQIGTRAGCKKKEKFIPAHSLALSNELEKDGWPSIELDKAGALQYLKKEAIPLDGASKGYSLVTHQGVGLGWINQIENRYNNLYPTHWRIRMSSVT